MNSVYIDLADIALKLNCIEGLSYVLWASMAEGTSEAAEEHTNAAYLLYTQLEAFKNEFNSITENARGLKQ